MEPIATTRASRIGWPVRAGISMAVLAVIFYFLPLQDVLSTVRKIGPVQWVLTLLVFLAGHAVSAAKWNLLASGQVPFSAVLRAHFAGLVANLSLPGVAGGDVVRAALLYGRVPDKARLALGSLADRLIDTVGLLLIAALGLALAIGRFASGIELLVGVGIALAICAGGVLLAVKFHSPVVRRLPVGSRMKRIGERCGEALMVLSRQKGRLVLCLVLSVAVQIAFIGATVALAETANLNAPIQAWLFAWPLAKLIATLPISIAGLGVREASLAGFLAPFGAPAAAVVAVGLVWQTVQVAGGFLGAAILLVSDRALGRRPSSKPK